MTGPSNPDFIYPYNGFFITIEHPDPTFVNSSSGGITGILPVLGCLLLTKRGAMAQMQVKLMQVARKLMGH